jgi:PKD repeat protein
MKVVKGTCFTTICKKIEIRNLCNLGADFTFSIENNIVKVLAKTIISDSVKYYWYFSNGISLEGREATFKYDKPGTYQMCLKVVRGSLISSAVQPCIQTVCKQIVINNAASCNLKPDFTYKIDGNTLQLAGKSGDPKAKYYWYSKELKLDTTGQEIKVSYSKTGVYQVCLKVINADETCKDYVCKLISAGNRITIFPNPSSDYLNIAVDQEISQLFIYNQLKVEVYAQKGANISPNVDISNLNEGIYTVTLFLSNGETITKRFYKK